MVIEAIAAWRSVPERSAADTVQVAAAQLDGEKAL